MARAILGWSAAALACAGASVATLTAANLFAAEGPALSAGGIAINASVAAFTVSVFPVLALIFALFFLWEAIGGKPRIVSYALAAPTTAYFGLVAFFYAAYGYGPVFGVGGAELRLFLSLAAGGAAFAAVRMAALKH